MIGWSYWRIALDGIQCHLRTMPILRIPPVLFVAYVDRSTIPQSMDHIIDVMETIKKFESPMIILSIVGLMMMMMIIRNILFF